ncbi:hypothetical protein BBW65_02855 [Helicobacter enhydrae]|uniref:TonB-dependent receptor-like beta-barrel domain-containing protein n=1 Tax=Helicobacter enhydrae TaxID=222136 RepID=A0A1B1U7N7_9HELI|nr:hypothetical protein BBW65_02855 [Helicobacter enhydrae]
MNPSNSIGIDLDYFGSQENTTPLLHFADIANPTKKDRFKAGNGKIKTLQNRISVGANYDLSLSSSQKLNIKAFFQNYNLKYQDNLQIMDYHYASFNLPNTHINQDGSQFLDRKIGLEMQYNLKHENGNLIIGLDSIYNTGERNLNFDIDWKGDIKIPIPPKLIMQLSSYKHLIQTKVNANKWSNSLFLIEKYDFTQSFSLTAGGRYELAYYSGHRNLYNDMNIGMNIGMKPAAGSRGEQIEHPQTTRSHLSQRHLGTPSYGERASSPRTPYTLNKEFSQITHNYALELTPAFYFQAGNVYVKYEKGFRSPSPDNLTSRSGSGKSHPYLDTNVKSEDYHTFEVGSKLFAGDFAFFSLAGYYTLTQNEIYTIGSAHSGNGFKVGNYKLTQRAGAEIVGEQGFFDERLRLIESFSYVDARILDSGIASVQNNTLIPYVSNYKATLGLNYTFVPNWTFWINQSFVGSQKDTAQNTIPAYNLTDFGFNFNHQSFSLSFGIRNLFDSFYYDFYNKDKSDEIVGYAFLIAQGRSYFLEGHYKF